MPPRRALLVVVVALILPLLPGCGAPQPKETVDFRANVEYGRVGDESLKLNIAMPASAKGPLPLVVVFHGGAWRAGDRSAHDSLVRDLANKGYVAATVGYRFCPRFQYPSQVQDAQCAVRFLRASAEKYHIDPAHVGAVGFSAGAHLSMMLGTLDPADGPPETGGSPGQPGKVQAVVSYFGPADLEFHVPGQAAPLLRDFLGGSSQEKHDAYRHASPISHLNKGDAPMLLFQGTADQLVPYEHATLMAEAMQKAGIPGRVELIVGGGHGNWAPAEYARTFVTMTAFFDEHLKPAKPKAP